MTPSDEHILAISEDRLEGFYREPFFEIACRVGLSEEVVIERLRAMMGDGTLRRIRQTFQTTRLSEGALVAWRVSADKLDYAFDFLADKDPATGHVVLRTAHDPSSVGADYSLWTTLKLPWGSSLDNHCLALAQKIQAIHFLLLRARGVFALGVGHIRRRDIAPGTLAPTPPKMLVVEPATLDEKEKRVLAALTPEMGLEEICHSPWQQRIATSGFSTEDFFAIAEQLDQRGLVGRFSTILAHNRPMADGHPAIATYNALCHWAVPPGSEIAAGTAIARHPILTHCYWRDSHPQFQEAAIMGMLHGNDKARLLEHKQAIDDHLAACRIPLLHTAIFWSYRSRIRSSI